MTDITLPLCDIQPCPVEPKEIIKGANEDDQPTTEEHTQIEEHTPIEENDDESECGFECQAFEDSDGGDDYG